MEKEIRGLLLLILLQAKKEEKKQITKAIKNSSCNKHYNINTNNFKDFPAIKRNLLLVFHHHLLQSMTRFSISLI